MACLFSWLNSYGNKENILYLDSFHSLFWKNVFILWLYPHHSLRKFAAFFVFLLSSFLPGFSCNLHQPKPNLQLRLLTVYDSYEVL